MNKFLLANLALITSSFCMNSNDLNNASNKNNSKKSQTRLEEIRQRNLENANIILRQNTSALPLSESDRLFEAIQNGDEELSLQMLNKMPFNSINIPDISGNTFLHWAVIYNLNEVVKCILSKQGIDVNAKNLNDKNPLMLAISSVNLHLIESILQYEGAILDNETIKCAIKTESLDIYKLFLNKDKVATENALKDLIIELMPTYKSSRKLIEFIVRLDVLDFSEFFYQDANIIERALFAGDEYFSLFSEIQPKGFLRAIDEILIKRIYLVNMESLSRLARQNVHINLGLMLCNVFETEDKLRERLEIGEEFQHIGFMLYMTPMDMIVGKYKNDDALNLINLLRVKNSESANEALNESLKKRIDAIVKIGSENKKPNSIFCAKISVENDEVVKRCLYCGANMPDIVYE